MRIIIVIIFLGAALSSCAQIEGSQNGWNWLRRSYNKELTKYEAKRHIVQELLDFPQAEYVGATIKSITSSKQGELTTTVYDVRDLSARGVLFVFWDGFTNDQTDGHYKGYGFRNLPDEEFKRLSSKIMEVLEDKKGMLKDDTNVVLAWDDLTFIFSNDQGRKVVRVMWKYFDSEWTDANMKTTIKRYNKFDRKRTS